MESDIRVQLFIRAVIEDEVIRDTELYVSVPQRDIQHAKETISKVYDEIVNSMKIPEYLRPNPVSIIK